MYKMPLLKIFIFCFCLCGCTSEPVNLKDYRPENSQNNGVTGPTLTDNVTGSVRFEKGKYIRKGPAPYYLQKRQQPY
ncbi:hypothetical protein phytr_12540 [Candidatus Phycorickettsia trachydisci]|uniref:Lipoprotein n=1 Tax=Candidatus Phycorickettsia trachydisci TaxID=2115978 RepID=A0A2P1PA89_9RICK|nr:hypothetical protein phytr_12540 [Candidatus Phycorickettsia trachydisci]